MDAPRRVLASLGATLVALVVLGACGGGGHGVQAGVSATASVELSSPAFADGEQIPVDHTCDGGDVAPALAWSGLPADTAEVVLTVQDPDAPGGTFVHWLVAGVPPATHGVDPGELPGQAVTGVNGFGDTGWAGPCPPPGDDPHAYEFAVYAVGARLDLTEGFSAGDLDAALEGRVLARGRLVGTYARQDGAQ